MSVRRVVATWNRFFFAPQSPVPIALFRMLYGLLIIATLLLLRPDWLAWYGAHAWTSVSTMHKMEPGMRLNLFTILPQSDRWAEALFWLFLIAAVCLTIGFLTRASSVVVFLCLVSIQQRNVYILNPGDGFLRVAGFFLMFAPAGAALSIDRLIRIWKGKEGPEVPLAAPWAQRMIQIEVALVYFATFCWKSMGADWVNGTALYYVFRLDEVRRFPLPSWIMQPVFVKIGTWLTLAIEFSLGTLIWFKELRYPVLLLGVLLHLTLEYSLNIPLFQWVMLSSYVLFIEPADLTRFWRWLRDKMPGRAREPLLVLYDGESNRMSRIANVLRAVDVLGRLRIIDFQSAPAAYELPVDQRGRGMLVATAAGLRRGLEGLGILARSVPILWPLAIPYVFARRAETR
jgi:hypothetical protein